jgi:hypothetical protein
MGDLIGGEQRFRRPDIVHDEQEGPEGEVRAIDLARNLEIIHRQLREAVTRRTVLNSASLRTPEEQQELETLNSRISELTELSLKLSIREGPEHSGGDNTGPPDSQGSGAA